MRRIGAIAASLLFAVALGLAPAPARATCVSGTITAELSDDPGFPGYYKYTLTLSWDLEKHELSHLDFFLALENCECLCDPRFIEFGAVAGHSESVTDGVACDSDYHGEYVCMGDPSLPSSFWAPAVKFEPEDQSCGGGVTGSGVFCFYSLMPPYDLPVLPGGLAIKHGQDICVGDLAGQIPTCDCALPNRASTWGEVKASYR